MPFNLFRKKKQPEQEKPAVPPQENPNKKNPLKPQEEAKQEPIVPSQEPAPEATIPTVEQPVETVAPLHQFQSKNKNLLNLQAKLISKPCHSKNYQTLKT